MILFNTFLLAYYYVLKYKYINFIFYIYILVFTNNLFFFFFQNLPYLSEIFSTINYPLIFAYYTHFVFCYFACFPTLGIFRANIFAYNIFATCISIVNVKYLSSLHGNFYI